jgi:hypothetical protein
MNDIFVQQEAAGVSDLFYVGTQASVGCEVTGEEELIVLRETGDGTYQPLVLNGITVVLSKYNNEIILAGPKNYKLQLAVDGAAVSAWSQE